MGTRTCKRLKASRIIRTQSWQPNSYETRIMPNVKPRKCAPVGSQLASSLQPWTNRCISTETQRRRIPSSTCWGRRSRSIHWRCPSSMSSSRLLHGLRLRVFCCTQLLHTATRFASCVALGHLPCKAKGTEGLMGFTLLRIHIDEH